MAEVPAPGWTADHRRDGARFQLRIISKNNVSHSGYILYIVVIVIMNILEKETVK